MNKKSTDLEVIKKLEKEIGEELKPYDVNEFEGCLPGSRSYSIDEKGNVLGLDLTHSKILTFPKEITKLKSLKGLVLWSNQLTSLPKEIALLENIQYLDLRSNKFELFPIEILRLKNIEDLDLSQNQLKKIPKEIGDLKKLERLHLSINQITQLPEEINQLKNMKYLGLGSNKLSKLPQGLENFNKLIILVLSGNYLTEFPLEIAKIKNLGRLDLSDNHLRYLPPGIVQLEKRIVYERYSHDDGIHLYGNNLEMPDCFLFDDDRDKMKTYFDNEKLLDELEDEIKKFLKKKLKKFYVSPFSSVGGYSLDTKQSYAMNEDTGYIIALNLDGLKMGYFPKSILKFKKLSGLSLSKNKLADLPKEIESLENLRALILDSNKFKKFPDEIFKLKKLIKLALSNNQINELPPEIAELENLEGLELSNNEITKICPEIGKMKNLEGLFLVENKLTELPKEIGELKGLKYLNLTKNILEKICPEIGKLENIQQLILNNNKIKRLPAEIIQLDIQIRLDDYYMGEKVIKIKKNPLESPPVEIVKQGQSAIKNYFESIAAAEETVQIYEAKLLIVGEGGVGKTTLVNALFNKNFKFNIENDETTRGIDIKQWKFHFKDSDKKEHEFTTNIWDFGGQEIYHATHQFFLTHRSLYVFVWEARQEYHDLGFYYWLNIIRLLSANSPVIIVMNKKEIREKVVDEATLREKFPNIVSFHKLSCATGEGIPELRKKIRNTVLKLIHIGEVLPKKWFDIRKKLETYKRDYIDYKTYLQICADFDLEKRKADHLSQYFHDLVGILHFQDNFVLKNCMILKPEWATHAVYDVLDTKSIQENMGKFNSKELENIWNENIYPLEKHPHLLELMKKFELAFHFEDTHDYLAPELLPGDRPPFPWNEDANIRFEYKYDFMPKGIITRFIVRNHTLIEKNYFWRNGVILCKEGTMARIISDYYNRKISVSVRGSYAKELLTIIRHHLDYIHQTLNHPPLREMIPCNCHECANDPNPHYYDYSYLIKLDKKGKPVNCQKSAEDISVKELLSGIQRKRAHNKGEWDVFISYSSKDLALVQEFVIDLQSQGISYWWDEEQIEAGDSISQKIENGLEKSRIIIVCLSNNQINSGWSRAEYSSSLSEKY